MARQLVAVNERGIRIGEDHQRAKLSNASVELVRQLREGGMSYGMLAQKFEVGKATVYDICTFRRRAQVPSRWRSIG